MRYIDRGYFNSWQVDPNGIWQYLDCIQKIAYFQFQNSSLDTESIFCDDINILIGESEDEILIKRNCFKTIDQYFNMKWNRNLDKPEEFIREQIDKGLIVGLNTYFYDIPNFNWYHNGEDSTSKHSCLIVGYDEDSFWLTDVPENMKSEYLVNQHYTRILNHEMKKYLGKQCNLLTFTGVTDTWHAYDDLAYLMQNMIKEYYALPYNDEGIIIWKGKLAYERLLYLLHVRDPHTLKMELYHGAYMGTIISGRRELLRRNILKKYGMTKKTEDVLKLLKTCAEKWQLLAYKILRAVLKEGVYNPNEKEILAIYESEKLLIECMERFVESNGHTREQKVYS